MTKQEQEKLFKLVRQRFKNWGSKQVSGYVHGVVDGLKCSEPQQVYIRKFKERKTFVQSYTVGYIYGFIDAYGIDTSVLKWSRGLNITKSSEEHRWWQNA